MAVKRSKRLVVTGWATLCVLYWVQAGLLVSILATHLKDDLYGLWILPFVPAFLLACCFLWPESRDFVPQYAKEEEEIWGVWIIWGTYIVPYVVTVAMIFVKVAHKLTEEDDLGVNALKSTLCITPALLILLLHLTICPSYRKHVLSISVFAALNIFDGIEMLEIHLMQNKGYFDLNTETEISIIVFTCMCFLLSSFGLARNKFKDGDVKERGKTSMILGALEVFGTNLPFLVIRSVIWAKYEHEASVFLAKNIISLIIGAVEFGILKENEDEKRSHTKILSTNKLAGF